MPLFRQSSNPICALALILLASLNAHHIVTVSLAACLSAWTVKLLEVSFVPMHIDILNVYLRVMRR